MSPSAGTIQTVSEINEIHLRWQQLKSYELITASSALQYHAHANMLTLKCNWQLQLKTALFPTLKVHQGQSNCQHMDNIKHSCNNGLS